MDRGELGHWLRLTQTKGVGAAGARILLARFGLPESIFDQPQHLLREAVGPAAALALAATAPELQGQIEQTWNWLHAPPAGEAVADSARAVITLADPRYPVALLAMDDPPVLLYAHGAPRWLAMADNADGALGLGRCIAIVGSRNPTHQGADNARRFASALAQAGLTVVSGLALGVDGAAHAGALEAVQPQAARPCTVAVVGTGLDRVYPKSHLALARRIATHALLLSEYPIGTPPIATNFPRRNRIIAGLSRGTLVVEAALQSGSLITARLAVEQGKDVFAIPGSIHATQSRGCHALIRQGAKLVESARDVLEELPWPIEADGQASQQPSEHAQAPMPPGTDPSLLPALGFEPVGLDALQARTGLDIAALQAQLMALELAGVVGRLPGGLFQRIATA